jgi:hypothetical protein
VSALRLFADPVPPPLPGIDLRCCDVAEVLREVRGARLIHIDAPWRYEQEAGIANPETNGIYGGLTEPEIVAHIDAAYDCAAAACRTLCWYTWPKEEEWREAGMAGPRWGRKVTGGAWTKMQPTESGARKLGHPGVGYHWRGETEPVALFTRGACGRALTVLSNGHVSPNGDHSEKPLAWLREWLRAWTEPGDLVLDLYAGLAPMARACALEGRRYIGAEIDPTRHAKALGLLAHAWGARP